MNSKESVFAVRVEEWDTILGDRYRVVGKDHKDFDGISKIKFLRPAKELEENNLLVECFIEGSQNTIPIFRNKDGSSNRCYIMIEGKTVDTITV